nr:K755 [uncultured bacterium]
MPWLTQAGMADLFQTTKQNIAKHLKAIFAEGRICYRKQLSTRG